MNQQLKLMNLLNSQIGPDTNNPVLRNMSCLKQKQIHKWSAKQKICSFPLNKTQIGRKFELPYSAWALHPLPHELCKFARVSLNQMEDKINRIELKPKNTTVNSPFLHCLAAHPNLNLFNQSKEKTRNGWGPPLLFQRFAPLAKKDTSLAIKQKTHSFQLNNSQNARKSSLRIRTWTLHPLPHVCYSITNSNGRWNHQPWAGTEEYTVNSLLPSCLELLTRN